MAAAACAAGLRPDRSCSTEPTNRGILPECS
jgi:hypothetical protein